MGRVVGTRKRRRARPGRSAFTIVELLVVIAIIGVLLALLIPAVQAAREAARRTGCQNHLRQLGVAVTAFHELRRRFPPGQCGGDFGFGRESRSWSWLARILPYVEQKSSYRQGRIPNSTLEESAIANRQIDVFLCPSDSYSHRGPRTDAGNLEGWPVGQTNYKGVSGANWGADESQDLDDIGTSWPNEGTNGSFDGHAHGDGLMWRSDIYYRLSASHVSDGLSNTFMVGEDLPELNDWCSWPYANNAYGTCAIPPNFTHEDPTWWPNTHSFRSAHPHGLNFAYADGSVHFVSDEIRLEVYRAMATRAGNEIVDEL